jgi:uncharacterized repeat protein (TIGR03803 family)
MRQFASNITLATLFAVTVLVCPSAQAQTFNVIHYFSGAGDGWSPEGRITIDHAGSLYGTAYYGGTGQYGTVFKVSHHGSGWTLSPLFGFSGDNNVGYPGNGVVFGPDGSLYGTTFYTVFNLKPLPTRPPTVLSPWKITTLYEFQQMSDGFITYGDLVFDSAGNIYGVTTAGGQDCYEGCGLVYELTPSSGGWLKNTLYEFNGSDGETPVGILFDPAGNLDGVAETGGANGQGVIFQLSPSGNNWTESILYNFDYRGNGGFLPQAGLISDASGNLYGSTSNGPGSSGTIFELSRSNGSWVYTVLAQIPSKYDGGPAAPLTMDAAGNLFGTINGYCQECPGAVFKLTHSGGGWTFTSLHDFTNGSDGGHPFSNVAIDASGNLYGTASVGGSGCSGNGCGVVWEITP